MSQISERAKDLKDDAMEMTGALKDHAGNDIEGLKGAFNKLREDVTRMLKDAIGVGKENAGKLGETAHGAVDAVRGRVTDLRDRSGEQLGHLGGLIKDNPAASAAIAFGVGFVIAKILTHPHKK